MLILRLIKESFIFAYTSLLANKLRTFLSLLGITIGIFAIISVFTVIDSLESYIRSNLNSLGSDMLFIQKWPWTPPEGETEYPWWKYLNRPQAELDEFEELKRRSRTAKDMFFLSSYSTIAKNKSLTIDNASIVASTESIFDMWNLEIERGRYFTELEMNNGVPVTVLGSEVVKNLFEDENPIGKVIRVKNNLLTVIGTYKLKGEDSFNTSMDEFIHISINKAATIFDLRKESGQTICVAPKDHVETEEFMAEIESIMRSIRRLSPLEDNDFALNKVSLVSKQLDSFFSVFNLAGTVIGGFSILVGGFGIANIMFVSVKERTKLIGIQKAIGAKRYFILLQFIFEAIVLSLIGGIIGLILIYFGTLIVNSITTFTIYLSLKNIIVGLLISSIIGFVAGFMPALQAARLDPVEAMNAS